MQTVLTRLLAVVLPILLVAGCQTVSGGTKGAECAQWRPITWSSKDTAQTRDEVKGSNARRGAWCK